MVGILEWTPCYKSAVRSELAFYAVDFGDFQSLFACQFRQYRIYSLCQHCLAGTGDTNHQHIMTACRSYLQRSLRYKLPLHISKIILKFQDRFIVDNILLDFRLKFFVALKKMYQFPQSLRSINLNPFNQQSFVDILFCNEDFFKALIAGGNNHRKNAANSSKISLK